jgi:hypothetical protein
MDFEKSLKESKYEGFNFIFQGMPNYLLAKHRVHKMFFRRCESEIDGYESCLGDRSWKGNIDKFITPSLRRQCYEHWVAVRRCATKNISDSFAVKLNMSRQIEDRERSEEEIVDEYETYFDKRKEAFGFELPPSEEEGGEGEEGGEEDAAEDGEASEGGDSEEKEEKKEENLSEEKNEENTTEERSTAERSDVNETDRPDDLKHEKPEETPIQAIEESKQSEEES